MKIETKYNIGDHIWVVYEPIINNEYYHNEPAGEIAVYDGVICGIAFTDEGIRYWLKDVDVDLKEEDIIFYEATDKLVAKIQELMKAIHDREEN